MKKIKSTIYDNGDVYDKTFDYKSDFQLWLSLTKSKKDILELCCGTGRLLMKLLPHHEHLTGIDNSKEMLAVAEAKIASYRDKVQLYKKNMLRFNLGKTFDSILLINNSFNHLLTESDVIRFQSCLKKHMTPDTEFILQTTPKHILDFYTFNEFVPYSVIKDPGDGKNIDVYEMSSYNSKNKLLKREWHYFKEDKLIRKRHIYVRYFNPDEVHALFTKNGFYFTKKYGGYDRKPLNSSSQTYITVIKKK
jgi:SAM-dependent methyltransferase